MSRLSVTFLSSLFAALVTFTSAPTALAASDCEAKAIDKNGKPLAGAAKASSIKKCEGEAKSAGSDCEAKAVSKDGKPLAGAAKAASIKKCEGDAKGGK